jgi:predicted O-linked N-acetylglucosamine transferase (SPINDLY family)
VGLSDLICSDWKAYHAAALSLSLDPDRLSELRATLRPLMREKMLDYDLHATEMMTAYDQMWAVFADGRPVESFNVNGTRVEQPTSGL